MVVVPAGVHHADVLSVVLRAYTRAKRHVDLLGHGQSVHIGAQCDNASGTTTAQHANNAVPTHIRTHLHPQRAQMRRHEASRAHLLTTQLRMLVDVATPGHHFGRHTRDAAVEVSGERRLRSEV